MNIRLRAAIYTVGLFAAIFAGAFAVVAIANLFGADAMTIFFVLFSAFLVWTVYELMLSKIKMDESIKESIDAIQERLKKY